MMEVRKRVTESGQITFQNLPRSNHFTTFSIFLRVLNSQLFHCSSSPRPAILLTGLSCSPTFSKSSRPSSLQVLLTHSCPGSCRQASLAIASISHLSCCVVLVSQLMNLKERQGQTGRKKVAAQRNFWTVVEAYKWGGSQKRRQSRNKEQT